MVADYYVKSSPRGFIMNVPNGVANQSRKSTFPVTNSDTVYVEEVTNDAYQGDPEMYRIWKAYRGMIGTVVPTSLVLALTKRFVELVPYFEPWVYFNATSARQLDSYGLDFIRDCINFALTGERKYSIMSWYDLIGVGNHPSDSVGHDRTEVFNQSALLDIEDLLSKWVSQKDGVRDLFIASNILFCREG